MARTSFYDDNKHRRYPFVSTAAIESAPEAVDQIPDAVVLACGFTVHAYSGFINGEHSVWLHRASYDSSNIILEFASDAPGLVGKPLIFTTLRNAGESHITFASTSGADPDPVPGGCTGQLLWMGFVVVGDSEVFVAWPNAASPPVTLDQDQHTVEPALVQNLDGAYVRSVNLANRRRVRTTDVPGEERPVLVNAQCMQGPIRFVEGKNCRIDYDLTNNGLVFSAEENAGDGETCVELPAYPGEVPVEGSSLLSGGPTCRETIKTINGVGGPRVSFRGAPGGGLSVAKDESNPHKINVTIDASFLASQGIL